ncbi:hypothetical protein [uncultured Amphritea sp.]|uniref:hypothetical protein n=1 Tax=uncultured Amphritea sp. TaxID=981605 RepID=UPI0026391A99|nr:hypothetical protein [uncultured Amphritea sp.]
MHQPDKSLLEETIVKSAELTRYAVKDGEPDTSKVVMSTDGEIAFVEKGVTNWVIDIASQQAISASQPDTPHVAVNARWYTAQESLEAGIEVFYGGSANNFGSMGTLLVPDGFAIPTVTATRANVKYYGLSLIETGEHFSISSGRYQTAMMRYEYGKDYKKEFLMQTAGGGGIFVETHDFPHVHIPLFDTCGGYIVIGKKVECEYHFTAFRIPFGYGLITPSGTIHGDGTLVGEYGLTVADSALASADTVLIYNENSMSMAQGIVPDWPN